MWKWNLAYRKMFLMSHVQCFALQKSTKHFDATRIITKLTYIGVLTPTYSGLWSQFLKTPLKFHNFWFCVDDMNCCIDSTKCKYALDRPVVLKNWPIKTKTNFTQDEIKSFEEARFVLNRWQ
jgi:hypothetical protein